MLKIHIPLVQFVGGHAAQFLDRLRLEARIVHDKGNYLFQGVAFQVFAISLHRLLTHTFAHKILAKSVDVFLGVDVADIAHLQALVRIAHVANRIGIENAIVKVYEAP